MGRPRKTKPKEVKEVKKAKEAKVVKEVEEVQEVQVFENLPDIIRKTVVIIGHPQSGKTTYSAKLKEKFPYHTYISCDDFKNFPYDEALYELKKAINKTTAKHLVIEGILGYRLLRKGLQYKDFNPEMVIRITRAGIDYGDKTSKMQSFCKQLDTIWAEYIYLLESETEKPEIIEIKIGAEE